ncbi:MAG TPA: hypothetical protein VMS99_04460 [Acidimicrobiia bacterium]|nr:hypothetical protein [Acidimicrobiia bacterium]
MLTVSACTGNGNEPSSGTNGNGATSPVAAVEELRSMLIAGDFASAGALAVPNQAALASLGEGASFGQVADAITDGDAEIAANFWSGFGQGVGEVLNSELAIEDRGSTTEGGVEFFLVGVTPAQGTERLIMTRDVNGQRIDLFASFGAGLAQRMLSPVEILLGTSSADSAVILNALQDVVPSLLVSATDPSLSPEAVQGVLQLVELITRVG